MQMIPELAFALLACARIGAIHSVVFGAFTSDALSGRITDCAAKILITQNFGVRGEKDTIPMKNNCDNIMEECNSISNIVVVRKLDKQCNMKPNRDV